MKKIFRISFLLLTSLSLNIEAQIVNVNPNPNGEPWIAGDAIPASPEKDATIPVMTLSPISQQTPLPPAVDNSDTIWMPPVFNQGTTGACVQVAEIWYTFGYEINRLRNVQAGDGNNIKSNLYHPFYTYNFLNGGNYQSTTIYKSGFDLIKENGCPSYETFNDWALSQWYTTSCIYWMHGYEKYYAGMHNTISGYEIVNWGNSYASLEPLKHWIADHNNGNQTGGLAIIAVLADGWNPYSTFPLGSPEYGKHYISQWGTSGGHALTIVGYHDEVHCFDLDGDGQYTNEDRDGDGIIELTECEKGAFKVVNSHNPQTFGDNDYIYVPYKLMAAGLQVPNQAYYCLVKEGDESIITVRTNFEHPVRSRISFSVGYAQTANDPNPLGDIDDYKFICFDRKGGSNSMRGAYSGPIEVEMNHSYFHEPDAVGKVFFSVVESGDAGNTNTGIIHSFSLVDHRWGENFELPCTQTDVYIANNDTTTLSINYHLLPHEAPITSDLNVNSDRVSRFTTTVPNGKTFRVATNTNIDMYNSEIHIDAGSTFEIGQNCTITAKRGTCKLVIDGNITVGSNVYFIAEEGAELQILLNNSNLAVTFPSTHFTRCKLVSWAQDITFNAALFDHCGAVTAYRGNVNAINSTGFDNSYLLLDYLGSSNNQFMATIDHCDFVSDELMPSIFLVRYGKYLIQNDSIRGFSNGIQLFYSGGGQSGYQKIKNNNIRNSALAGVKIYTSTGEMSGTNYIHGNNFGIQLFNNCNILLAGNPDARSSSLTQKIADNSSYEFYATNCSFPAYFKYNAIIDDNNQGNPTDPLLYYDNANCQPNQVFDVAYNYWGTSFNAASDLKLNCGTFNWMPVWYPGGNPSASAVEDLYMEASSLFENGSYEQAVLLFQLLIEQYPTSSYAPAAMKELLRLESFTTNNYNNLKEYYLTDNTIANDSTLSKLGAFLANKCDVELGNWENAIAWYENQILNPTSSADSIFAIIDLGDIYLLMQNQGLKSSYVGKLAQYKPESKEQYAVNRDYLLSLLPFEKNQNKPDSDIAGNNQGFLNQNSPNPFSESTQINYSITRAGNIDISVRNLTGQEIINLPQGTKEKGSYSVGFFNQALPSGFYFFSLKIDGNVIATRKMCVSR